MPVIRTPEEQFASIQDFPYQPHYLEVGSVRVHYLDEGAGDLILCLHGEPTWAYLYRKFIPILSPGYRVMAMDFIGFGRSDKYTEIEEYSYRMHLDTLLAFIEGLDLKNITLVVQDWGGLLGLAAVAQAPERFARLVIMNTFLPVGNRPMPLAFKLWRGFAKYYPGLPIGFILKIGTYNELSKDVIKAYNAPFPSNKYKAGAKAWPLLVPMTSSDPGVAEMKRAREVLSEWRRPALVMFSDKDPIMRGGDRFFRGVIPSAKYQPRIIINNAGHFLQEDSGEEIAGHIKTFMEQTAGATR